MGRTGSSWGKIGVFYLIFYSFLAGFFSINMAVFYQTLDTNFVPTYVPEENGQSGGSILQHPALGFRPLPRTKNVESTLIWYQSQDINDVDYWTGQLDDFIAPYEGATDVSGQHTKLCSENNLPGKNEVCIFQDRWLGEICQKNEDWGYKLNRPCVLLKMNKMIGWTPKVYENLKELPANMPQDLKDHIAAEEKQHGSIPKRVWISCKGENPADQEYIGPIKYMPHQGFNAYYFPYRKTDGYLSPIVAVEFKAPQPYVLINVECRAWAKNIEHSRGNRLGLVHFELLKD